jgi:class 3 adenylate cyclase
MSWNYNRARERILRFDSQAPVVRVEKFDTEYMPRLLREQAFARNLGSAARESPALYDLPNGAAILVDTAHVYVRALSYDEVRLEQGRETEASHARALAFLGLLYGAGDRVVDGAGAQRVDFHGARLHAVVAEPGGTEGLIARVATALALAEDMMALARAAGQEIARDARFPLRFRVGIDVGPCVAINSGRSDEREPMFIGPAANHAAKLAHGNEEGIYLSDRVRALFSLARAPTLAEERARAATTIELAALQASGGQMELAEARTRQRLDQWARDVREQRSATLSPATFQFHHHTPPLATIDYSTLSPSHSIRMALVSIFADLDKYTAYIDHCMRAGCIGDAVRLLHVIRSEFNAVLQDDFDGRKVRFIGDCIHGLIASGTSRTTDLAATVALATSCAAGLRSSFKLCRELVANADRLGLAIGFELGETPVTRIGIRGDRAVRTASSLAVRHSEECQRQCMDEGTIIGPRAYDAAPYRVRKLFGDDRFLPDLTFADAAIQLGESEAATGPAIMSGPARAHAPERAHSR